MKIKKVKKYVAVHHHSEELAGAAPMRLDRDDEVHNAAHTPSKDEQNSKSYRKVKKHKTHNAQRNTGRTSTKTPES